MWYTYISNKVEITTDDWQTMEIDKEEAERLWFKFISLKKATTNYSRACNC